MYKVHRTPVNEEGKYPIFVGLAKTYQEAEAIGEDTIKSYVDYDFTENDIFITFDDLDEYD